MGVHQLERIACPTSVEEAWEVRTREAATSRFLAGGVDLVLYAPPSVTTLIDLSRLGIGAISRDGDDLVIGAMATLTDVLESGPVRDVAGGFLATVLRRVASPLQRNLATFGGAVVRAHPWSDVVPALLVLDAQLDAFDGAKTSLGVGQIAARADSVSPLVVAVRIPGAARPRRAAFEKFTRTAFDVAILNCACSAVVEDETWRDVRVAVGGTPAVARRLPGVESMLEGRRGDEGGAAAASHAAALEIDARDDRRASAGYRRRLTEVGVARCLAACREAQSEASR